MLYVMYSDGTLQKIHNVESVRHKVEHVDCLDESECFITRIPKLTISTYSLNAPLPGTDEAEYEELTARSRKAF